MTRATDTRTARVQRHLIWGSLLLLVAAVALALNAGASTAKAVPYCKSGQKTTKAHPCVKPPRCKAGQASTKAHPCAKASAGATAKTTGSSSTSTSSAAAGGTTNTPTVATTTTTSPSASSGTQANGCPLGQIIPQGMNGGDGDEDNMNGGDPEDGDGCA